MTVARGKIPVYVFDLDGTTCNGAHRFEAVAQHVHGPYNEQLCHLDTPHEHVCELARDLLQAGRLLVFMTGRSHTVRRHSESWLKINVSRWWGGRLYMRTADDMREDAVVKSELMDRMIADGFTPIMVFDDRNSVVAMWRARGIPCAQVALGDF